MLKRLLVLCLLLAATVASTACTGVDLETEEGRKEAIEKRVKVKKALDKLTILVAQPEKLAYYADALNELYLEGSGYDRDVISLLAALHDSKYEAAYEKAAQSDDMRQVQQAAIAAKEGQLNNILNILVSRFAEIEDPETQRMILEVGLSIKNPEIAQRARQLILEHTPIDTSILTLRSACQVLGFQQDPKSAEALMLASFYSDGLGRTIAQDCQEALLQLKKAAIPEIMKAFDFKIPKLNAYVEANSEKLTPESVRLTCSTLFAKLLAKNSIDKLITYLTEEKMVVPPALLAVTSLGTPQWTMWGSMVGMSYQEAILAMNDIGIIGNEKAKAALLEIYNWPEKYDTKFRYVIMVSGINMVEISLRVNALRTLAQNEFLEDEATLKAALEVLKDPSFNSDIGERPAARSNLVNDIVTYLGIVSKPGQVDTVWKFFADMKGNELKESDRYPHIKKCMQRIDNLERTYKMADECQGSPKCFAKYLKITEQKQGETIDNADVYLTIKAVYELGKSKNHQYFKPILDIYGSLDTIGRSFALKALINLGKASDVATIDEALKAYELNKDAQLFAFIKRDLTPLKISLQMK